MLPKEAIDWFKKNNIDLDALVKAHTDEKEVAFTAPTGNLYTDDQLQQRSLNDKAEGKKDGEGGAMELAKAEFKKRGLDLKGNRWGDLVNEVNALTNQDKETKITALQEQNAALLKDVDTYKTQASEAALKSDNVIFEHSLYSSFPANPTGLNPRETYEILKLRGYTAKKGDDGQPVWEKNGQQMKDGATHGVLANDKAIAAIWGEMKWDAAPAPQGRNITGTGASSTSGVATFSGAKAKWLQDNPGKSVMSPEFMEYTNGLAKENPSFAYDK